MRIMNTPYTFTVEGVFRDFPRQSHFHANYLVSMEYFRKIQGNDMFTNWGANSVFNLYSFKGAGYDECYGRPECRDLLTNMYPRKNAKNRKYELQPLLHIHLNYEKVEADIETQGSITRVTIFTSIAILVLIIAVVNFLLLSLALSYQRIREFGIRTIAGARRRDLVSLVSAEFLIVFVLAVQIALMLVELTIPLLESRMNFRVYHGVFSNAPTPDPFYGAGFSYRLPGQHLYCLERIPFKTGGSAEEFFAKAEKRIANTRYSGYFSVLHHDMPAGLPHRDA